MALAKYLYCIIPCSEERLFDLASIGNERGLVHTVSCQGLAAVVSGCPPDGCESTRENMMAHEKVVERVMQEFPLLPVRFGTVTESSTPADDIRQLLSGRSHEFSNLLQDLDGKAELGLKALWRDEGAIFQEVVAENPDIRWLRDSLLRQPSQATQKERMSLGGMVKTALERKRYQEAARLLQPLRPLASRLRENKVIIDRMLLNAAFLVDKRQEPEFDKAINGLEAANSARMVFKYIGPAPPYNFVSIVVNWQELKG